MRVCGKISSGFSDLCNIIRNLLRVWTSQWRIKGRGPGPPSLFWVKKRKGIVEGRKAGRASDNPPPPQPKTSALAGQVSWQATCEDSLQIDPQKTKKNQMEHHINRVLDILVY